MSCAIHKRHLGCLRLLEQKHSDLISVCIFLTALLISEAQHADLMLVFGMQKSQELQSILEGVSRSWANEAPEQQAPDQVGQSATLTVCLPGVAIHSMLQMLSACH